MITDHEMDDQLRAAGNRWRAAQPDDTRSVDVATFSAGAGAGAAPARRTRWIAAAAAAVVVAGIAVGATMFGSSKHHTPTSGALPAVLSPEGQQLVGTEWTLVSATTTAVLTPAVKNAELVPQAALHFAADGAVTASDGCNTISGPSTISASTIEFGELATTAMGCLANPDGQLIDEVLQGDVSWGIAASAGPSPASLQLTITRAGLGTLVYSRSLQPPVAPDPAKIQGSWTLTQYQETLGDSTGGGAVASGGGAVASGGGAVASGEAVASGAGSATVQGLGDMLTVRADSTFTIQHRCYSQAGTVTAESGTAVWSNVHPDGALPCPYIPDQQERQDEQHLDTLVDGVLSGTTTWTVDAGNQLTITKGGDSLTFTGIDAGMAHPSNLPTS